MHGVYMRSGDITIIASGTSVLNVALDRLCGFVIGVNDSAIKAPHVDAIVSMDRLWAEYRWPQLQRMRRPTWLRRSAVQNIVAVEQPDTEWLTVFENDNESSVFAPQAHDPDPPQLNGTNSGACALNLAYQMAPKRIFLLGFDMCRDRLSRAYWHDAYPWRPQGGTTNGKYAEWAGQFAEAKKAFDAAQIEVINVSPQSAIRVFPKMTPAQYLKECR